VVNPLEKILASETLQDVWKKKSWLQKPFKMFGRSWFHQKPFKTFGRKIQKPFKIGRRNRFFRNPGIRDPSRCLEKETVSSEILQRSLGEVIVSFINPSRCLEKKSFLRKPFKMFGRKNPCSINPSRCVLVLRNQKAFKMSILPDHKLRNPKQLLGTEPLIIAFTGPL